MFHPLSVEELSENVTTDTKEHQKQLGAISFKTTATVTEPLQPYTISYIDFGMMGSLSASLRQKLMEIVLAIYTRDIYRIEKAVINLCQQEGPFDESEFHQQLASFLTQYLDLPLKKSTCKKSLRRSSRFAIRTTYKSIVISRYCLKRLAH